MRLKREADACADNGVKYKQNNDDNDDYKNSSLPVRH